MKSSSYLLLTVKLKENLECEDWCTGVLFEVSFRIPETKN